MKLNFLIRAQIKLQRPILIKIAGLTAVIFFTLILALTLHRNAGQTVAMKMDQLGTGDLIIWIHDEPAASMVDEIAALPDAERVTIQPLIFSAYTINDYRSDDEGQLIASQPQDFPYTFLNGALMPEGKISEVRPGEVYLSAALRSSARAFPGDEIQFLLGRDGSVKSLIIAGYFEDPLMGASMIDMKAFLISPQDMAEIRQQLSDVPLTDRRAHPGAMLHIDQAESSTLSRAELTRQLNTLPSLTPAIEMIYSKETLVSFMTLLETLFCGFLIAFAVVLTAVSLLIIGHTLTAALISDQKNIGILKTLGYRGFQIQWIWAIPYGLAYGAGALLGLTLAIPAARLVSILLITSTGLNVPQPLPLADCAAALGAGGILFILSLMLKTRICLKIRPVQSILRPIGDAGSMQRRKNRSSMRTDLTGLTLRQLTVYRKQSFQTAVIAAALVFFTALTVRLELWTGSEGEGLMNAFSAAELDLGVQPMTAMDMTEIEAMITSETEILSTYELAMPDAAVNGTQVTANVISDPQLFHILKGRSPESATEIVLTEMLAEDLRLTVGSTAIVSHEGYSAEYQIVGLYQCANGMGANLGMNAEGYARIGDVTQPIWCRHYMLADAARGEPLMRRLQQRYPVDLEVHTHRWSGLDGIVLALHATGIGMLAMTAFFLLISVQLSGSRLLQQEQHDLAILKSLGLTTTQLRCSFTLRIGLPALAGALGGTLISLIAGDSLLALLLRQFGIGDFQSRLSVAAVLLPSFLITNLFCISAWIVFRKIRQVPTARLLREP